MLKTVFFTPAEYRAQEDARILALSDWEAKNPPGKWTPEKSALSASFFPPGSMWFCPWNHDPQDEGAAEKRARILARPASDWDIGSERRPHLSRHYWQDWADKRPPICVVCPGGGHWMPDSVSSNGDGWTVTGEPANLTAHPSIWVNQGRGPPREYHGWLQNGVFSHPV